MPKIFVLAALPSYRFLLGFETFNIAQSKGLGMTALPQFTERYLDLEGQQVRYIDEGSGPVLFLLHGILACLEFWSYVIPLLTPHYRVIAIDNLGFGKTAGQEGEYTVEVYANFISKVLDALHIERCFLVGHSLAGIVALRVALNEPQRIQKLMIIDGVGFHTQVALIFRLMKIKPLGRLMTHLSEASYYAAIKHHVYHPACLSPEFIKTVYPLIQNDKVSHTTLSIVANNANFFGIKRSVLEPQWAVLDRLKDMPILILWGRNDTVLNIHHLEAAKKLLPQARTEIFEECGHLPIIEYPEKTAALMQEFFA